ncbi:MAG TPA: hypothetical protein VLS91_03645, partial [Acidimicrobiales bacterium]|nr:hypothetical protein [Acidimicrobiales bacterium]
RAVVWSLFGALGVSEGHSVMHLIGSWDSKWYLTVAQNGYATSIPAGLGKLTQTDLGFFPLLPILIRATHVVTGLGFGVSAVLTTTVLGALGAVALWWLLADTFDLAAAELGTAFVFFSPAAFVLAMFYSESAIILFVSLCLLWLGRRRWILAGLAAARATSADPVAVAVVVPCVVAAVGAIRSRRDYAALAAPLIAPLGVGAFFVYLWAHTGSLFEWFHAQRNGWQEGAYGSGLPHAFADVWNLGFANPNDTVRVASAFAAIAMLMVLARVRPPLTWTAYVLAVLAMGLFSPIVGITPRLLLRGFPIFAVLGVGRGPRSGAALLVLSTSALAVLTILSATWHWTP